MGKNRIIELLGQAGKATPSRTTSCPDEYELAAYLGCESNAEGLDSLEAHLAKCDFCMHQVGVLMRAGRAGPVDESMPGVSDLELARARRMGAESSRSRFKFAPRWAAAAVVVLSVGLLTQNLLTGRPGAGPISEQDPVNFELSSPRQFRSIDAGFLAPRLLSPLDGSVINPAKSVFKWTEVPGSMFYDVRLVSLNGDLVRRERISEPRWALPTDLELEDGAEYFVRVDAYLSDAKFLSSEHILFRVEDR